MNVEQVLRDVSTALEAADSVRGRDRRLQAARQVLIDRCVAELGVKGDGRPTIATVLRLAAEAAAGPARESCAVLFVHALVVPGLVPGTCEVDICSLAEVALRRVLLRFGYPFSGSIADRMFILRGLPAKLGDLMQPLEPTFPNWQGLYAG